MKTNTLILTTNVAAVHQWIDELTDKSTLTNDDIGEYTGDRKEIKPITIGTYQILVWRKDKQSEYKHFQLFKERNWGLIIYDEVHLLPAPVFRVTAELQTVRRVGLTATLVREDGAVENVFSLVGPKRFEIPWKQLEARGWIAEASFHEIRIDLSDKLKIEYAVADSRKKFRISSENPIKMKIAAELISNHREDSILVIGQYIKQLQEMSKALKAPIITGKTPNQERERIFEDFRQKKIKVLVVEVEKENVNIKDNLSKKKIDKKEIRRLHEKFLQEETIYTEQSESRSKEADEAANTSLRAASDSSSSVPYRGIENPTVILA